MLLVQALLTTFTTRCALANDFATLCAMRLFVGVGASGPIPVVGLDIYADVYPDSLQQQLLSLSMFTDMGTARGDIHWVVPILSALPFGMRFLLMFMSLINYLVDAYEVFAASAMAASACSRSLFVRFCRSWPDQCKYQRLGVTRACSLLGFLSLAMCIIPFAFVRFGTVFGRGAAFANPWKQIKQENEEREVQERRMQESGVDKATTVEKLV
ncbi:unnamed protein product, partial [Aureobasidium mustum]